MCRLGGQFDNPWSWISFWGVFISLKDYFIYSQLAVTSSSAVVSQVIRDDMTITEDTARAWASAVGAVIVGEMDILGAVVQDGGAEASQLKRARWTLLYARINWFLFACLEHLETQENVYLRLFELMLTFGWLWEKVLRQGVKECLTMVHGPMFFHVFPLPQPSLAYSRLVHSSSFVMVLGSPEVSNRDPLRQFSTPREVPLSLLPSFFLPRTGLGAQPGQVWLKRFEL